MVYTDTDSFVFHTRTDDIYIYTDLTNINDEMDFSGYDENHRCFDACDKKVLGKFKDHGKCWLTRRLIESDRNSVCLTPWNHYGPYTLKSAEYGNCTGAQAPFQ